MIWEIEFSPAAAKGMRKADRQVALQIRDALVAAASLDDPRSRGRGLSGALAGLWRYRVGDYRIICDIRDSEMVIIAIEIGARDGIYD